nr:MAG TPA: hypothetical protein [Caudoviricetes sp.]
MLPFIRLKIYNYYTLIFSVLLAWLSTSHRQPCYYRLRFFISYKVFHLVVPTLSRHRPHLEYNLAIERLTYSFSAISQTLPAG